MQRFRALAILALLLAASPALAQRATCHRGASFEQWLDTFKREAVTQGVSQRAISAASHLMVYDQQVVNKDRGQKVFGQTFLEFSDRMVAKHRIDGGIQRIAKNRALFQQVEQQFGVPAPVIAAFWALETDFGGFMGNLPTIKSVTSLAYDCRRPDLFRTQLLAALKIIDRGDLSPEQMIGPFAGELGQFQFLPAHYFDYGVDYDGDGRRDLIRSAPDAVASAANYLSKIGWKRGQPWLEEVRAPANMDWAQADLAIQHPRSQWARWGVTRPDGSPIAADAQPASLLLPMGRHGPAFLAYPNFQVFLEWNQSLVYSTERRVSRDPHQRRAADEARLTDRAVRLGADPRAAAIAGAARPRRRQDRRLPRREEPRRREGRADKARPAGGFLSDAGAGAAAAGAVS